MSFTSLYDAPNWPPNRITTRERIEFIFNRKEMADIHLVVGKNGQEKKIIPAHKFVLSTASRVFNAMFNGPMATKEVEIEIPDIEPGAFLRLLKFMYTGETSVGADTVMFTLYAAKKYEVPAVRRLCIDFLKKHISPDNAFIQLSQALFFQETDLIIKCMDSIEDHPIRAFSADDFKNVSIDALCAVLGSHSLKLMASKEVKIFKFLVIWSEAECRRQGKDLTPENKRQVMGPALKLIRFHRMTREQIANEVAETKILTAKEILRLFFCVNKSQKPNGPHGRFRFFNSNGWIRPDNEIGFTVDRSILLTGFKLYSRSGCLHEISICDQKNYVVLAEGNKTHAKSDSSLVCKVRFKKPLRLQAGTEYLAISEVSGCYDLPWGNKGSETVEQNVDQNSKVTIKFFNVSGSATKVSFGQLFEFLF